MNIMPPTYKDNHIVFLNPLPAEFCFRRFTGPNSFGLPTHSRDAHRKFFDDPFFNKKEWLKVL